LASNDEGGGTPEGRGEGIAATTCEKKAQTSLGRSNYRRWWGHYSTAHLTRALVLVLPKSVHDGRQLAHDVCDFGEFLVKLVTTVFAVPLKPV
jgi:hypothetical protein